MAILRTDIIRALDDLIYNEAGTQFQALAVVLAKQKWPDLIASEWHNDGGLDAYAPASLAGGTKAKGVASSLTANLSKIKGDAKRAQENYRDLAALIFVTPHKVTASTARHWAGDVRKETGLELYVISREDIIISLLSPSNASQCSSLLRIQAPIEQDDAALLAKVHEAVAEQAETWRTRQRMTDRPIVALKAVKLDGAGKDTSDTLDNVELRTALSQSRRIALEAHGGSGKTTTLIQLAAESPREGELSFLVDLPVWIRSGIDILDFITRSPAFRARNISAVDLARLNKHEHFSFLLNGWNEIAEVHSESAITALSDLERSFPSAGIIVATRTHYLSPPLPGAIRVKLLPWNRRQRADYLHQALGDRANELRAQLEGNRVLDGLTRTPFILAEVVTIHQSGQAVPTTRIAVLDTVTRLIEVAPEHRPHLQIPPLSKRAAHYLTKLAAEMTARGEVEITEEDARKLIQSISAGLLASGQLDTAPNADTVMHTLSAHHVLEQIDYPGTTFRFQHQRFQEFYAARFLSGTLAELAQNNDDKANRAFAEDYINIPTWEEPLRMVAEELRTRCEDHGLREAAIESGVRLITLALGIDPILASDLARLCGPGVWDAVRSNVGKVVRDWYAVGEPHHRQLALAAMLATGSDDFADVVVPLLTDRDQQIRLGAYRAAEIFYPTSLGADWRCVVGNWDEESRADFVSEVTRHGLMADIGESFAINDPSAMVRSRAIRVLSWIAASDALTRVIDALDDAGLEAALPSFMPETVPEVLRPRFVAANRRLLQREATPLARIRCLLQGLKFGDTTIVPDLTTQLSALSAPLDQYAEHSVAESLKIVKKHDANWASAWVAAKLLDGTLIGDQWQPFLLPAPLQQTDGLISQLASREQEYREVSATRVILTASATPELAGKIFAQLCDTQRVALAAGVQPLTWKCLYQIQAAFRAMPVDVAIEGVRASLAAPFDANRFTALVGVFGRVNADADELRSALPDPLRDPFRDYLKQGIAKVLADNLLDNETRAHSAVTLGRIGDPEDLQYLRSLIDADVARDKAKPSSTTYSNWFVEALLWLAAPNVDTTLIELLYEDKYLNQAAHGLLRLALPPSRDKRSFGITLDYEAIWAARAGKYQGGFDAARAKRYGQAITQRMTEVKAESRTATNPQHCVGRIKDLAVLLAALDGRESAAFVIDALTLPGEWDAYSRMNGVRALVSCGVMLRLDTMLAVLDPAIEHSLSQGLYNDQNLSLLVDCLELLLFSDDPAGGVTRIEEVLSRFQHRPYQVRDLVTAAGHTRSEAVVPFLLNIARGKGSVQNLEDAWIEALGRLGLPAARAVLLSFIDPQIPWIGVEINFDYHNVKLYAAFVGDWARKDTVLKQRLIDLSAGTLTRAQRQLLPAIYREIGSDETMVAAANLLEGNASLYIRGHALETMFLEQRPHGDSGFFVLIPRNAERARAHLFHVVLNDPARCKAAFSILGQVEVWRIEHGRPNGEPRHPMIESGQPWPPISVIRKYEM